MADQIDVNDPQIKELIKQAVADATEGLENKNRELLGEVKKLKKETGIKPEDLDRLQDENEQLKTDLAKAQKESKTYKTDLEKATAQLQSESAFTQKLVVDNGLTDALVKVGVKEAVHLKAAKAMLMSQVKLEIDGENRVAKMGDKALSDAIAEWAATDEGKFFVAAPNNSGGGSNGGAGSGNSKTINRADFDALLPEQRAGVIAKGYIPVD